ncbi:MAG: hypothetical protein WCR72_15210 [Bacteroidota bacterium]
MANQSKVKPRNPEKQEYAYLLYMQGMEQQDICNKVQVSAPTLTSWKKSGEWETKRAARTISIDDLVQKTLKVINEMLDNKENFSADAFAKAVNQLKTLKTSNTVDDDINTFMGFQDYMIRERTNNKDITDQLIKSVTALQDNYIQYRLGNGRLSRK